ncbi:hypothetical protein SSABA_v1c03670 [Spiroplasma sabaudiense Ar-1343]|uniref:Lipoprotein n=1 Tax=Spiroplasma sabaudiense Ar-1343 TaxID=1276257 RepID=W6A9X0_9MOLU|nr:hypothetical protein [Spiroplasma sabaudiense]AHI53776.1 hypothetical protein SSABA_v1c03670 [Spiroplasma sabaudiense Ar-1343]
MKKTILSLASVLAVATTSSMVVSCDDERINISEDIEENHLGFLPNSKNEIVFSALKKANPNIDYKGLVLILYSSYAILSNSTGSLKYKRDSSAKFYYNSKLSFGSVYGNSTNCNFNKYQKKCNISINILDKTYDEKIDGKIKSRNNIYTTMEYWIDENKNFIMVTFEIKENNEEFFCNVINASIEWNDTYLVGVNMTNQ